MNVEHLIPEFDLWADETAFVYVDELPTYSEVGDPRNLNGNYKTTLDLSDASGKVSFSGEVEPSIQQAHFTGAYWSYPFDRQVLQMEMKVAGMDITNCHGNGLTSTVLAEMGIETNNAAETLLPQNKEWFLDGDLSEAVLFTRLPNLTSHPLWKPKDQFPVSVKIAILVLV